MAGADLALLPDGQALSPVAFPTCLPVQLGPCAAWLHPAQGPVKRACGVVLCPPFGYEALGTRRGWRMLADTLSHAGLHTLRFDHTGTGDSPGEEAPGLLAEWLEDIARAIAWMRARADVSQVALCGLRLGGLLAASVAASLARDRVAALALLAPVWSGAAHARELRLMSRTQADEAAEAEWLNIAGFRLHRGDLPALSALELGTALSGCSARTLILGQRPGRALPLGPHVEWRQFPEAADFLRDAHLSMPPVAAFREIASWLASGSPEADPSAVAVPQASTRLAMDGVVEQAIAFGDSHPLYGVYCTPAGALSSGAPAALLLNTGANHWTGNGRFAVHLARRLARQGVASLRFDAAGIGDSPARPDRPETATVPEVYCEEPLADIRTALDWLHQRGHAGIRAFGLCAGAHFAWQAALRDERLTGLVLVNLPAFDRSAGGAPALDGGPPPGEIPWLRRPRMLVRRLRAEADTALAQRFGIEADLDPACGAMRRLMARGVRLLLAYSDGDRGLRELRAHFGRQGRRLSRWPGITRVTIPDADHAFSRPGAMEVLLALVERHLLMPAPDRTDTHSNRMQPPCP